MQGRLLAGLALALALAPVAAASTCTMNYPGGSMQYECGSTEPPPPKEEPWYANQALQFGLAVVGLAGSGAAGGFAYWRTRQRRRTLSGLLHAADTTYAASKAAPEEGIPKLVSLRVEVRQRHARGRLEDAQYLELDKRISDYIVRLRVLELDRRFGAIPAALLAEVKRLVSDGAITKAEADLVSMRAATHRVMEPQRSDLVQLVRSWASEDAAPKPEEPITARPTSMIGSS